MKTILAKTLLTTMILSLVFLAILLHSTTPAEAGATGILSVFILAYIFLVSGLSFLMYFVSRLIVLVSHLVTAKKPLEAMSLKKAYYFSSVLGLAPVILLSMRSVGSFGVYELSLVTLFVIIGCIYVAKRTA